MSLADPFDGRQPRITTVSGKQLEPLLIKLTREPGAEFFLATMPDGSSEELEATEAVEWFRMRHAGPMDYTTIERAIDDCWNFYAVEILIKNPRAPKVEKNRTTPNV